MPHQRVLPAALLAELHDLPALHDAACRGLPGPWDDHLPGECPQDTAERHRTARRVCRRCPARAACSQLAATYPTGELRGVWAGRLYRARPGRAGAA